MDKVCKASVLYLLRPGTDYTCGDCVFIRDENKCAIYGKKETISPSTGTCGLWGEDVEGVYVPFLDSATKVQTGYEESPEGFSCGRCHYFDFSKSDCSKVDKDSPGDTPGMIHFASCCNLFEADDVRVDKSSKELVQIAKAKMPRYVAAEDKQLVNQ